MKSSAIAWQGTAEADASTLPQPGMRCAAGWLASEPPEVVEPFLTGLSDATVAALPWMFEFWAMPHQLPPLDEDWDSWLILGGRGAGKTRAGAEWVRSEVEGARPEDKGRSARVALVGETFDQVRDVMIMGESGILACSPPDRRPEWQATRRRLVWPNGAVATAFSAREPEALRGPQFDAAWVDELGKWKKAEEVWTQLQFALRLGPHPRRVVTTTPRNRGVLKALMSDPRTRVTQAPTRANRANLAASFLREVERRHGGTRLGRQELDGEMIEDVEGALWQSSALEAGRLEQAPALDRIVVAVDPPVTGHAGSDECGIIVAGASTQGPPQDWRAVVLADLSLRGSPDGWIRAVVEAARLHRADRVVAEVNQGGDLVETLLRQHDALMPYRGVRASRSKGARAEPVAALYEQGRVAHLRHLARLEDQMCQMTAQGFRGDGSPDRLDALVWALWDLLVEPGMRWREPRTRLL